ncbi:class I glutamine amidotransferase-like protein [Xylariaceae sp. FL0016]|nr:class I glutamine amidotransferase-like protein [Xylariaceae sp. FL0016]
MGSAAPTTTDSTTATRPVVRIGIFIPTECQLLDLACVDIMGSMSYDYLELLGSMIPQAVLDLAPSVEMCYIGCVKPGEMIKTTSGIQIRATHHFSDEAVAPGSLDIVLVPGPDPASTTPKDAARWLGEQGRCARTDVLSVCSGIFVCGDAGLLKGKTVCGPRGLQDLLATKGFGEKSRVGHELRWIQDGNFWSGGGVTNGNDLVAAYCRTGKHFPKPLVEIICETVDVGDRGQEYAKGQSGFLWTMVFNSFRAWLMGFGRAKR